MEDDRDLSSCLTKENLHLNVVSIEVLHFSSRPKFPSSIS